MKNIYRISTGILLFKMFKKITSHIITFLTVFLFLFILSLTRVKADTELWSISSFPTISNSTGWLFNENITPLTIGHHYQVRYSVLPGTFLGTYCVGDEIGDTDCIELGTGTHIIESWQVIYTATGGDGVWDFYPDQAYDYLDAYAWCPDTSGCTLTSFSLWEIGEGSPIPIPTETPSPTPIPVTKVVFVPGFGASWNANAFASCSFDPDPNNWTLASYASDIYSPLIDQIKNTDRDLKEFYYDWKAQIQNNSNALAGFIDSSNLAPDEKIDIVGHSMGGLIGMDYLLESTNKVNGLLTVGSPFKGSALAYPTWEGGDVWNDNFLAKIAITLYVKHCGNVLNTNTDKETIHRAFPSIGDLLPKFNYLNNFKTGASVYPLYAQNTWFNSVFAIPNGVKVETISGVGFNTLSNIAVKPANKRESDLELWQDGKPSGKQYSTEGDGTVLATSSQLDGAVNITLTKTHSGLVSSQEGINEILNFLGLPQTLSGTLSEPTSALVIIGYPSNFWITDQNGRTQKDKDGMVSFMNPKSGSFKLNALPKSNKTLFVVAQFLPNGDVKYKEYKFDGFAPKFKTLMFDLQNPTENILD